MADEVNSKKRPLPDDGEGDADKLAARREANRIHALKSRQRSKALLQELQRTVTQLSGEKSELERENAVMRAQIEVLQQQNIALTQSQRMLLMRAGQMSGAPGAAAMNGMNAFAPGLFGLSHAASMPASAPGTNNGASAPAPANGSIQGVNGQNVQTAGAATSGATNSSEGMDQAAVAAAAAAMIQGQAAAAAAAAGFQPHFAQKFMQGAYAGAMAAGSPAAMGGPTPANTPAAPAPAATSNQTPVGPNDTPVATPAPPQAPPATAIPPEGALGQGPSQQSVSQGDHPLLA
eukprot:scaffold7349_cov173-Amphora_coffeaeformis.AAC.126